MNQDIITRIINDFANERRIGEFVGTGSLLRNVACVNPDATRKEFIAAAVASGFNKHTATIQFAKSRSIDLSFGFCELDSEGRLNYN
jgi:hypothetical protein